MLDLLLAPIDPGRAHAVGQGVAWHGRLMVLAWGFLFPLGIVVARFFKVTPWQDWPRQLDNKAWWHGHRALQYAGGLAMLAALLLVLVLPAGAPGGAAHRAVGWTVAVLVLAQFLGGWLRGTKGGPTAPAPDGSRRGDHYDMTRRRVLFELAHKTAGYALVGIASAGILSGLWLANAPVWMWLALGLWWTALIAAFAWLQRRGYALDTYQAIWGPDPRHPGNARPPIGWGIRR